MKVGDLIDFLISEKIEISVNNGKLVIGSDINVFSAKMIACLKENKSFLISWIEQKSESIIQTPPTGYFTPSDFPNACIDQQALDDLQNQYPLLQKLYVTTPMQEGLLFHGMLDETGQSYAVQTSFNLSGNLEIKAFKKAWQCIVDRHDTFRTCFVGFDTPQIHQLVQREIVLPFVEKDWRENSDELNREKLQILHRADKNQGFDFSQAPLMRITLVRLADDVLHCLWTHHHSILDGWCSSLLFNELMLAYDAFSLRKIPVLSKVTPYENYIGWLRKQDIVKAEAFWTSHLSEIISPTTLNMDKPFRSESEAEYEDISLFLTPKVSKRLNALVGDQHTTLNVLVQAVWSIILQRYSGESCVVFGATVSGRPGELSGVEEMMGLFINTIPHCVAVDLADTVGDLMDNINDDNITRLENSHISLSAIQQLSKTPNSLPLFESLVIFENYPSSAQEKEQQDEQSQGPDFSVTIDSFNADEWADYPITLVAYYLQEQLSVKLSYKTSLFYEEAIKRMVGHLERLFVSIASGGAALKIRELTLISDKEASQLSNWQGSQEKTPKECTIQELFEQQVKENPDAIAVVYEESRLTYGELNSKANQLAHYLIAERGVTPDTLVGLCVERSLEMIVGIMGILKAGGAYVPLDPSYPAARLEYMFKDANLTTVLTQEKLNDGIPLNDCQAVYLDNDEVLTLVQSYPTNNTNIKISSSNHLAYVIYTSGSTGNPKGVMVEHRAFTSHISSCHIHYQLLSSDNVLQFSTINFDAAQEQIFSTLTVGATLCLFNRNLLSEEDFYTACKKYRLTIVDLPPSYAHLLFSYSQKQEDVFQQADIRLMIVGGESLPKTLLRQWKEIPNSFRLINAYGPTEAVITAAIYEFDKKCPSDVISIGKVCAFRQSYVCSEDMNLLPIGVSGELYIGGPSLARGYLNQPDLTREKFVPNPFYDATNPNSSERLYKTGDLVRYLPDGNLEFLGRIDHQVKVRGFRIELGEIEHQLLTHDEVNDAVVVGLTNDAGDKYLVAYVTHENATAMLTGDKDDEDARALRHNFTASVKTKLCQNLPYYMMPFAFVVLEQLPLTPNGKVDRKVLPAPDMSLQQKTYVAPSTETEKQLCEIWQEVLSIDQVGITDNFFELGGHSLLVTRLITMMNTRLGIEAPLKLLFRAPTISDFLSKSTVLITGLVRPPITLASREQELLASFAQQRLWILDKIDSGSSHYNMPGALRLTGELNVDALTKALSTVVERHESLRTYFTEGNDGQPLQVISPVSVVDVPITDISLLPEVQREFDLAELVSVEASKPFDLSEGAMLRAQLIKVSNDEHVLLMTMHHIASDGWSMGILTNEFSKLYSAYVRGEANPLLVLEIQYADYAQWQRDWLQGEVLDEHLCYWEAQLAGLPVVHSLPLDNARPNIQSYSGAGYSSVIDSEVSDKLNGLCQEIGGTLFMGLHAAFSVLLSRYSNETDIIVGSPIANREQDEVANLIGFFVNVLVLRSDLSSNPNFRELLEQSKEMLLDAYEHQQVPFEKLVEKIQPERSSSHSALFQVMLVLQNDEEGELELPHLVLSPVKQLREVAKYDLTLNVAANDSALYLDWEYNTDLFNADTIERLAKHFELLLTGLVNKPEDNVFLIDMLPADEVYQQLIEWNDTQRDYPDHLCLHEMFEAQALRLPGNIAVVSESHVLSYGELNIQANRLAHYLIEQGVGPDSLVGLCMDRSVDMIVGLLAIIKSGGAYVPIDPNYPDDRIEYMFNDSAVVVVLIQTAMLGRLSQFNRDLLALDSEDVLGLLNEYSTGNINKNSISLNSRHLAYVVYTSGSTGLPKGVMTEHYGLVNYLITQCEMLSIDERSRIIQFSSISFVASMYEIWVALISGAALYLPNEATTKSADDLSVFIKSHRLSHVRLPPTMLPFLKAEELTSIKHLKVTGESCPISLAKEWAHGRSIYNSYGATECSIGVSTGKYDGGDTLSIGKPLANKRCYIVDEQYQILPLGVPGELLIGGDGLARGYLNQKSLTAEMFINNPFTKDEGDLVYRTGDLVRWLPNGELEFLGRIDHQVKIRGFRVELGEIENQLLALSEVKEAIVLAREDGGERSGKRLVAYIVKKNVSKRGGVKEESASSKTESICQYRAHLKSILPDYMVPVAFVLLEQMPLTPNGKVNRKALPEPNSNDLSKQAYVRPVNSIEVQLCELWKDVLQLNEVGIHDNFFEVGGNSLLSIRMQRKIQSETSFNVSVTDLFTYPTIFSLVEYFIAGDTLESSIDPQASTAQILSGDIAIVGMAARFPGAGNIDVYWNNLCQGKESLQYFSDEKLMSSGLEQALIEQENYVKSGVVLENIDLFDANYFGFTPLEAEITDPQQRILLECAVEALEQGGYGDDSQARNVGVFVGVGESNYFFNNLMSQPEKITSIGHMAVMSANSKDFAATRLSYKLNLTGPSINVVTACSTSLVAVHQACNSVLRGESSLALAGGASISKLSAEGYLYEDGGVSSSDGHCRTFDADADGTREGSGAGVILLKRLEDALADGDNIHAIIKGSAINNDGSDKVGYTAPSVFGQARVIREALTKSGVEAKDIDYIEAHGTGTKLGDPIEIAALTKAFNIKDPLKQKIAIGSVKANIGHCDAAAGVAGLIKVVEALKHRMIPPAINYRKANPAIDFSRSPFYVNTVLQEWPKKDGPRRAGVSSFGIGGTNAHIILEEAPAVKNHISSRKWLLLPVSSKTSNALEAANTQLLEHLQSDDSQAMADVAYTLQVGRAAYNYRSAVVCDGHSGAVAALNDKSEYILETLSSKAVTPSVIFMFPGQGAQYVNMGKDLYQQEALFQKTIDTCAELLLPELGRDIREIFYPDLESQQDLAKAQELLAQTVFTQPALFVVEYAMAVLWKFWGVQSDVMIGHSVGEYVAACLSEVLTLEDALSLVCMRGRLMQSVEPGNMLSVLLIRSELLPLLEETECSLAAVNSPGRCVVSGSKTALRTLQNKLEQNGVISKLLVTSHAFHSVMMDEILEAFAEKLTLVKLSPPRQAYISNVSGDFITEEEATDPSYWVRHLRHTVEFSSGVETLLADTKHSGQNKIFLEVGPGMSLSNFVEKHDGAKAFSKVTSFRHAEESQDDGRVLMTAVGKLWSKGVKINWNSLYFEEDRLRVALPTYPFIRQRFWVDKNTLIQPKLLQKNVDINDWFYAPSWKLSPPLSPVDVNSLSSKENTCCLVFEDMIGLSDKLLSPLANSAAVVMRVRVGKTYSKEGSIYTINIENEIDYRRMFNDIKSMDLNVKLIVHAFNVTKDSGSRDTWELNESSLDINFFSLLFLCQALEQFSLESSIELKILVNQLQKVTGDENVHPDKASLTGICRVISNEMPHINCQVIDVLMPKKYSRNEALLIESLVNELLTSSHDQAIAYRGQRRWLESFEKISFDQTTDASGDRSLLKSNGTYLISGGLGGMGLVFAEYLSKTVQANLILLSRSCMPPKEDWEKIIDENDQNNPFTAKIAALKTIEDNGSEILISSTDITNESALKDILDLANERFGKVDGVIHAAGVAGGTIIPLNDKVKASRVMTPKIMGTYLIDKVFSDSKLDFVILCSSLSSILGGIGQFDYCAANAFQDAYSQAKENTSTTRYISINWDVWSEVGMAVNTMLPAYLGELSSDHINAGIRKQDALVVLQRVLDNPLPQIVVSTKDLTVLIEHKKHSVVVPEETLEMLGESHSRPDLDNDYISPVNKLEKELVGIWQKLLGIERIGTFDDFFDLGGDSLLATGMASMVREQLKMEIDIRAIFENPTILSLSTVLNKNKDISNTSNISSITDWVASAEAEFEEGEF